MVSPLGVSDRLAHPGGLVPSQPMDLDGFGESGGMRLSSNDKYNKYICALALQLLPFSSECWSVRTVPFITGIFFLNI